MGFPERNRYQIDRCNHRRFQSRHNNKINVGSPKCLIGAGPQYRLSTGAVGREWLLGSPCNYPSFWAAGTSVSGDAGDHHRRDAWASFLGSLHIVSSRTAPRHRRTSSLFVIRRAFFLGLLHHYHPDHQKDYYYLHRLGSHQPCGNACFVATTEVFSARGGRNSCYCSYFYFLGHYTDCCILARHVLLVTLPPDSMQRS